MCGARTLEQTATIRGPTEKLFEAKRLPRYYNALGPPPKEGQQSRPPKKDQKQKNNDETNREGRSKQEGKKRDRDDGSNEGQELTASQRDNSQSPTEVDENNGEGTRMEATKGTPKTEGMADMYQNPPQNSCSLYGNFAFDQGKDPGDAEKDILNSKTWWNTMRYKRRKMGDSREQRCGTGPNADGFLPFYLNNS